MSKQEVIKTIGKKPDNVIGAKEYDGGVVEVIQYSRYEPMSGTVSERYWLYFWNNTLKQWGRPGDWHKEADKVYELRVK
ncbi:MAG: hypothetical protein WCF67_06450 [Chitinophagaceae bacterium]